MAMPGRVSVADAPELAAALGTLGPKTVIVKLGDQGCYCDRHHVGFRVDAVDTTAAGDTFNAGLAVALAEGRDLADAIRFANAAAAISVTRMGAQPSAPNRSEIEKLVGGKKSAASAVSASRRVASTNGSARQKGRVKKA